MLGTTKVKQVMELPKQVQATAILAASAIIIALIAIAISIGGVTKNAH